MKKIFYFGIVLVSSVTIAGCSISIGNEPENKDSSNNEQKSEQKNQNAQDSNSNNETSKSNSDKEVTNISETQSVAMTLLEPEIDSEVITADELLMAGEIYGVPNDGYLNLGENNRNLYYSTMTPAIFYERTVSGSNGITIFYEAYDLNSTFLNNYSNHIRPVVNIDISSNELLGDGTVSNPYQLESTS